MGEAACFMFTTVAKSRDEKVTESVIKSGAPLLIVMVLRQFSQQAGFSVRTPHTRLFAWPFVRFPTEARALPRHCVCLRAPWLKSRRVQGQGVLLRAVEALKVVGLEEASTAGAVKLAGAPAALESIVERFPGTGLGVLAGSVLEMLSE